MTHIIGIDPGKKSGWGVVSGGLSPRLLSYGQCEIDYDDTATDVMREILDNGFAPCVVAIEEQYIGANIRSGVVLARNAGRWEEAAAECGCTPTFVWPASWHARELKGIKGRPALKKASVQKVKGLYKIKVPDHVSDAILIARYCAIAVAAGEL